MKSILICAPPLEHSEIFSDLDSCETTGESGCCWIILMNALEFGSKLDNLPRSSVTTATSLINPFTPELKKYILPTF